MAEETRNYAFFQHKDCEYFPCHEGIDPRQFNCLFCYCPLYCLGDSCGGSFRYTEKGVKDCTGCTYPHEKDHYDALLARFPEIREAARKKDPSES